MTEDWQKLDTDKTKELVQKVNPFLKPVPYDPDQTVIRKQNLPFYKGYMLLELTDMSNVPPPKKYALYGPSDIKMIDWTNTPIYETNRIAPLILTRSTVVDYVRFFFSYVRGRYGRFLVIETVDDIRWQKDPPLQGRKTIQEMLKSPHVTEEKDDHFSLEAFMVFKDSLFKTEIQVEPDGTVTLQNEDLKIENMPVFQDVAV